ncbi:14-3-3 family protein [Nocardia sp. NPDC060256]|uniref:14-3-3 family protein n=1 Tax=unclassified Nocardia TaxID=2637762 RepID=UPI00365F85FA
MADEGYQDALYRAQLSERAERYDDMVTEVAAALRIAYEDRLPLDAQLPRLFQLAYDKLMAARRTSWQTLLAEKHKQLGAPEKVAIIEEKISVIGRELIDLCDESLAVIDRYLTSRESYRDDEVLQAFVLKMKGDYCGYKAGVLTGPAREEASGVASHWYVNATEVAESLDATHPIKLGIALNHAVFYHDVLGDTSKACAMATAAFDKAVADWDGVSEHHYQYSSLTMQLLRENAERWRDEAALG